VSTTAAIVLAGGKSSRLGRDKASEPLLGRPLIQHVIDRLGGLVEEYAVVRARGQQLPEIEAAGSLRIVEDVYPEIGPLGGIYTGLDAIEAPRAVAVGCDMPLLQPALLRELIRLAEAHDLVVPVRKDLPEPLCAVYAKTCLAAIRAQIEAGEYKIARFYDRLTPRYVSPEEWRRFDPEGLSFQNVNRDADLARVESLLLAEVTAPRDESRG
jgi:molybdopterin-guanine dinucleotide biosynthesis protein A